MSTALPATSSYGEALEHVTDSSSLAGGAGKQQGALTFAKTGRTGRRAVWERDIIMVEAATTSRRSLFTRKRPIRSAAPAMCSCARIHVSEVRREHASWHT